jgi:anti-sigma regulatory factor (Ser/Thr protein kinase)
MAAAAIQVSQAAQDPPATAGAAVIGSLTIPGRPERVREARAFVAKALGEGNPLTDVAVLLASELVTNAILHTSSGIGYGTVALLVLEMEGGLRIEVADAGSDSSIPTVKGDVYVAEGHGLLLVQRLADQWGYFRDEAGLTVWFWLRCPAQLP